MSDVWNEAAESKTGPQRYFGQLLTSANYVRVTKGEPKVPFDSTQHSMDTRFAEVKIGSIVTLDDGTTYDNDRSYLCSKRPRKSKLEKDWREIVNPSLEKLDFHPRDLGDAWACWEMVPTGRTWISKRTDEQVKGTAHSFIEFYPDEETCRQAEAKFYNRAPVDPEPDLDDTMPMTPTQAEEDKKRADMAGFLPGLWDQYKPNADAFYAAIASNPMVAAFFDSNSPEVVEIIGGAA